MINYYKISIKALKNHLLNYTLTDHMKTLTDEEIELLISILMQNEIDETKLRIIEVLKEEISYRKNDRKVLKLKAHQ